MSMQWSDSDEDIVRNQDWRCIVSHGTRNLTTVFSIPLHIDIVRYRLRYVTGDYQRSLMLSFCDEVDAVLIWSGPWTAKKEPLLPQPHECVCTWLLGAHIGLSLLVLSCLSTSKMKLEHGT